MEDMAFARRIGNRGYFQLRDSLHTRSGMGGVRKATCEGRRQLSLNKYRQMVGLGELDEVLRKKAGADVVVAAKR